ncbi:MAG: acyl-CoA dehydrogenase, partial [Rhodoferax sp.]|nr:acyl-CoA dehydrogenase [Rhodoferax sp.]
HCAQGDQADAFIVSAKIGDQIALFLVPFMPLRASRRADTARRMGRVRRRSGVQNAAASLITTDGLTALEHAVDIGIAASCVE